VNALGSRFIHSGIKHKIEIFVHSIKSGQNKRQVSKNGERKKKRQKALKDALQKQTFLLSKPTLFLPFHVETSHLVCYLSNETQNR